MAQQQQHVDYHRKVALRRRLLTLAPGGPAYVPFCGDGDLAVDCYADRGLWLADLDPERVATAILRPELAHIETAVAGDCNTWPFDTWPTQPFAVLDFDAYSEPYTAFRDWWARTPTKGDRMVVLFTDGHRQGLVRSGSWLRPDGTKVRLATANEKRRAFNFYFPQTVKPWWQGVIEAEGYRQLLTRFYLRNMMIYWGSVIERTAPPTR